MAGGGNFSQPLTNDNIGGLLLGGNPIASPRLFFNGAGPAVLPAAPTTEVSAVVAGPYNNMGVPGAKSFHLLANGYGNIQGLPNLANPYFVRMASSPNASVLEDAMAQNPTFFSLWIGNNDVLGYATTGGDGSNPITDQGTFDFAISTLVTSLTSGGAGGVVANIPDVTSIPHFTTVPHNPVPLDEGTAAAVNQAYAAYNAGLQAVLDGINAGLIPQQAAPNFDQAEVDRRQISFVAGEGNAVVVLDENLSNLTGINPALVNMRQATAEDLLVLPSSAFIGTLADPNNPLTVNGVAVPLADKWVLTPEEQTEIKTATDAFNATISNAASQAGLAFVDANTLMNQLADTGLPYGDYTVTAKLVTGGVFSLDGVHPTARGYAFLANEFMKAIDAKYGSNFVEAGALTRAGNYPTNYSPALQ